MIKELTSLYKKSSLLSIRYIIVVAVAFFINIFINKLDVQTISYFYAVALLMYFLEQSEIAIADVVSIYTVKVARNKNKKVSYLKTFFILLVAFIFLTSALIIVFREPLFDKVLGITVSDNYRFLYLMLISYAISVPTLYFQDYLKYNDKYKEYLNTTVIFNVSLIIFFFFYVFFDKSIKSYALANIVASIITTAYTFDYIRKHMDSKFDSIYFMSRKAIDVKNSISSSIKILIQYTFYYLGSFIKSITMIKISIDLFNANEFLSKIFWICEGMFEALITTINIKLTKLLAEDTEKAFKYAKKSFRAIIINQLLLAIIYLIFRKFILGFINPEVYIIANKVDILLLVFVSLSVVDWALSYNILIRNNKIGIQVFLELFVFIGFTLFLILTQLGILNGMYTILLLMNALILVRVFINIIYFYTKKWL